MAYVMYLLAEIAVYLLPVLIVFRKSYKLSMLSTPLLGRQLSQSEIDELVHSLLSKRKRIF